MAEFRIATHKPTQRSIAERRISLSLLSYWERLRKGRPMPAPENIDPSDLHDLWDHCFLIHIHEIDNFNFHYSHLGSEIRVLCGGEMGEGRPKELTASYVRLIEGKKPLVDEGVFVNTKGETIGYRQCLLPLGSGETVEAILGGVRFRIFPSQNS